MYEKVTIDSAYIIIRCTMNNSQQYNTRRIIGCLDEYNLGYPAVLHTFLIKVGNSRILKTKTNACCKNVSNTFI